MNTLTKSAIKKAYEQHGGVVAAAVALGCHESTFRKAAHGFGLVLRPKGRPGASHEVYGLYDPRTEALRYLGIAKSAVVRFTEHLRDGKKRLNKLVPKTYKRNWIAHLLSLGMKPECKVLAVVCSQAEAKRIERALIARCWAQGVDITNGTKGGDGVELTPELLARRVESQRAFYKTPAGEIERERKRVVGRQAKALQVYTAETREKMRQAKLGKPQMPRTPEWKAKIAAAQKGKKRRPWTDAERARHMASMNHEKMSASAKARTDRKGQDVQTKAKDGGEPA